MQLKILRRALGGYGALTPGLEFKEKDANR